MVLVKRPAITLVVLYAIALLVFTLPVWYAAHGGQHDLAKLMRRYHPVGYTIWFLLMVGCQAALLIIPVRLTERRPVSRRDVRITIAAAAAAMAALLFALGLCVAETVGQDDALYPGVWKEILGIAILSWLGWAWLFHRYARRDAPAAFSTRVSRWLIRGSALELLVAVPTHVLARHRAHCCAGMYTFLGIAFGMSVMALAFGPAVYVLYRNRLQRKRAQP